MVTINKLLKVISLLKHVTMGQPGFSGTFTSATAMTRKSLEPEVQLESKEELDECVKD